MNETLQQIGLRLASVRDAAVAGWADLVSQGGAPLLVFGAWLLIPVGLLILISLVRRIPARREVVPVQLLVSRAAMVPEFPEGAKRVPVAARPDTAVLTLTLGNLNRFPVQWLEVAVRRSSRAAPKVARIDAIVPALSATDVAIRLPNELEGDLLLDVIAYASNARRKLHRHRVTLEWDAWGNRWSVSPHDQRCQSVARLAGDERGAVLIGEEPSEAVPARLTPGAVDRPASVAAPASDSAIVVAAPDPAPPATLLAPPIPAPAAEGRSVFAPPPAAAPSRTPPPAPAPVIPSPAPLATPRVLDFVPPPMRPHRPDTAPAPTLAGRYRPSGPTARAVAMGGGDVTPLPAIHDLDDIWHPLPEPVREVERRPRWPIAPMPVTPPPAPVVRPPAAWGGEASPPVSFVPPPAAVHPPALRSVPYPPAVAAGDPPPPEPAAPPSAEKPASPPAPAVDPREPTVAAPAVVPPDPVGLADLWSRLPRRLGRVPIPSGSTPPSPAAEPRPRLDFPEEF